VSGYSARRPSKLSLIVYLKAAKDIGCADEVIR
jgi:hypothetical protein